MAVVKLDMSPQARERYYRGAAILVASLVPAMIDGARELALGKRVEPAYAAFMTLGALLLLAVLTANLDLCMRRRLGSAWLCAVAALLAVGLGAVEGFLGWAVTNTFGVPLVAPAHKTAVIVARMGAVNGLLGLGLWAMAVVFPFAIRDAHARAIEAERLHAAVELARLRANLQPHFLFNTLSTIAGLIGEDPRQARQLIGALGELLRDSLAAMDEMQTLEAEVDWLKRYASILEARHRGALAFHWDIAEATRSVRIPSLLLQPLLENAVKHGALRRPEGGEVVVRATLAPGAGDRLRCMIEDNGPGPPQGKRPGALGIETVTRRLALKYAGAAAFRLESGDGRTRSIVDLPVSFQS